ncbi:MAG: Rieske (2Fe-2S) protein [Gemmatimonadetes bacterium]|nr:Rieske (2Fe-2S) protein [Gemmatimonadota bacterium]
MNRRTFVGVAAAGWLNACASMVMTTVTPVAGRVRLRIRDYITLDRPGGYLKIRPEGSNTLLYVLALEGGGYSVVSPVCKHLGCTVDVQGRRLLCPCHGSMYGRDGRVLRGPTQAPLDRFPAEVSSDGVITIDLERNLS